MGIIRMFQAAQKNGVSAVDFVRATNFDELARQSSPARAQQAAAPALQESLGDWARRHLTQGATATAARPAAALTEESVGDWRVRRFKRESSGVLVDVAPSAPEVVLTAGDGPGVLQESRLRRQAAARAVAARPAADRLEWVRRHRSR
jgi:hypothetical protein